MKINIKKLLAGLSLFGFAFSPLLVSAETGMDYMMGNKPNTTFCVRISSLTGDMGMKFTQLENHRGQKRMDMLGMLATRKQERTDKIEKIREGAESKFEKNTQDIEDSATTDEEKAAIEAFKTAVKNAQTTRKAAVDAAMKTFHDGLNQLVTNREDLIKTATTTFKTAMTAAMSKAKADCAAGGDATTIRTTLIASMKTAREKLQQDLKALEPNGQKVKDLAHTRNEAIQAANKAFKDAVAAAKADLEAVLKP